MPVGGSQSPIKETTPQAIKALHEESFRIAMLTGDSKATAQAVAKRPGIDEVIAEVLPKQNTEKSRPLLGTELPAVRIGNTIIHSNKDGKIH